MIGSVASGFTAWDAADVRGIRLRMTAARHTRVMPADLSIVGILVTIGGIMRATCVVNERTIEICRSAGPFFKRAAKSHPGNRGKSHGHAANARARHLGIKRLRLRRPAMRRGTRPSDPRPRRPAAYRPCVRNKSGNATPPSARLPTERKLRWLTELSVKCSIALLPTTLPQTFILGEYLNELFHA